MSLSQKAECSSYGPIQNNVQMWASLKLINIVLNEGLSLPVRVSGSLSVAAVILGPYSPQENILVHFYLWKTRGCVALPAKPQLYNCNS